MLGELVRPSIPQINILATTGAREVTKRVMCYARGITILPSAALADRLTRTESNEELRLGMVHSGLGSRLEKRGSSQAGRPDTDAVRTRRVSSYGNSIMTATTTEPYFCDCEDLRRDGLRFSLGVVSEC
jgi:hypothetical protein